MKQVPFSILGVMGVTLLVRLYGITSESPWCDEVLVMGWLPATNFSAYMDNLWIYDFNAPLTPLYFYVIYGWSKLFGTTLIAFRAFSLLCTLLSVPLLYRITQRFFGKETALYATLLFALHPMFTHFGQEVRFYALMILLALLSTHGLCNGLYDKGPSGWLLHVSANAALIALHAFGPILYVVQGLFLLYHWRLRIKPSLLWGSIHIAFCLLLLLRMRLIEYHLDDHAGGLSGALPSWREAANALLVFAGGRFRRFDPTDWMPGSINLELLVLALALLAVAWSTLYTLKSQDEKKQQGLLLCLLLLVFPLAFLYAGSWLYRNMFFYRYVIYAAVAFPILIAYAITTLKQTTLRRAALALILALLAWQNLAVQRPLRADYNSLATAIQADGTPKVLSLKALNHWGIWYALDRNDTQCTWHHGFHELCTATIQQAQQDNLLWVTFYHWDRLEDFETHLTNNHLTFTKHTFNGIPPLHAYRIEKGTP